MNYASTDLRKNEIEFVLFRLKNACAKFVFSTERKVPSASATAQPSSQLRAEYYAHQHAARVVERTTAQQLLQLGYAR